ncbi:MAG: hypothetical protein ACYTGV_01440 [Planctomycetota bacterium]
MSQERQDPSDRERGLTPREPPSGKEQALGTPFAAMAEALRANAEALHRIDQNQRKIAESLEKGERATKLVANTRALNETFRGLSDIQRGLLDAVVSDRGRGRGLPFAFAAIAILAALLGFLLYERWTGAETVSRELYDQSQQAKEGLTAQVGDLRARLAELDRRAAALDLDLGERDEALAAGKRELAELGRKRSELESELATKEARLREYLSVKEVADRTGAVEVRNIQLEGENRDLRDKLERTETERNRLLELLGEEKIANRGPDPKEIIRRAEEMGIVRSKEEREKEARIEGPDGPGTLTPGLRRRVRRQLNHLLQQAPGEEAYELIDFQGIEKGTRLTDVKVARYRNAAMLNSLNSKELEVVIDVEEDTVELRFKSGYIVNTGRPTDKIPFGEDGHFVFLREAGATDWLERSGTLVRLGEGGTLAWKTGALLK